MSKINLPPVQLKQPSPAAVEQEQEHKSAMSKRPPALQMKTDETENEVKEDNNEGSHDFYADSRVARDDTKESHHAPFQLKAEKEELSSSSPGSVLPVLQQMSDPFGGFDFSDVKIHKDSDKAPAVGAQAFAQGKEIHFAPGKYDPGSAKGKELIGHEMAHVVQQSEGRVKPTGEVNGLPLNDNKSLEAEADAMGRKFAGR